MAQKPYSFRIGTDGENIVRSALGEAGYQIREPESRLHDFIANDWKIEVKNDIYTWRSGNIAIEIWNCKKNIPSGLLSTDADIWFHIIKGELWWQHTSTLKDYISHNKGIEKTNCGDQNATLLLYSIDIAINEIFNKFEGKIWM